ncbi:MAG: glycosyltransferase 87 family protein, partial [Candidatus Thorarchaeota archaeon]
MKLLLGMTAFVGWGTLETDDSSHSTEDSGSQIDGSPFDLTRKTVLLILVALNILPIVVLRFVGREMYPFFIVVFLWIGAFTFLIGTLVVYITRFKVKLPSRTFLVISVFLTILSRLLLIGLEAQISIDPLWYLDFGKFMMRGYWPYADFYFPYPPVFAYFIYAVSLLWPVVDSFRILSTMFDVLIVVALWMISKKHLDQFSEILIPLAYSLLPISVIESGLNGHFEPIANLFLLLAIWCLFEKRGWLGGIFLGLSAATKVYAFLLLPIFPLFLPTSRKKLELIIGAGVSGFLTFIPLAVPVWIRGDFIFPGTAVPGGTSSGGFVESVFGFTLVMEPIRLLTLSLVGITAATIIGVFLFRRRHRRPSTRPFTYDLLALGTGILITALALIAAVYPFTQAAFTVYWRYPADIGVVRGALSIVTATIIMITAFRRWRFAPDRSVGTTQKILMTSVGLLLLLSLSRHVFYGWYLLWAIPPLLLMRDRRLMLTILVCFLMLYPSYTHDNFANLGYSEEKTWRDDFTDVGDWSMTINLTDSGIDPTQISARVQSIHGIGAFSINARQVENPAALSNVSVTWSRNVTIPVTSQTEFGSLVSASYDPTFGRLALFGLYFE